MRSSSIFSSRHKRLLGLACGMMLALVASEAGARLLAPGFGHNGDWPSNETFVKYTQLSNLSDPVETVYVGSSLVAFGVDSKLISERTGNFHYNAALSAGQIETLDTWTREFVVPLARPRRIVLGVGPTELAGTAADDGNRDRFAQAPAIAQARHPTRMRSAEESVQVRSELFNVRRQLRSVRDAGRAIVDGEFPQYWGPYGERQDDFGGERVVASLDADSALDGPSPERIATLNELVDWLTDQGIEVVLLEMPASPTLLDQLGGAGDDVLKVLEQTASRQGVSVIDGRPLADQDELFFDGSHLNPAGQAEFSQALSAKLE